MSDNITRRRKMLLYLGSIGPLGHLPASGTVTVALIGVPVFWFGHTLRWELFLGATTAFIAVAVWLHGAGDQILGAKDSRRLVWDELAGFFVAITHVPFTWQLAMLAFLLERFLDIIKFPPARYIENHWPGGWGVVGDDVVAGLYTCAILHLLIAWTPAAWLGLPAAGP